MKFFDTPQSPGHHFFKNPVFSWVGNFGCSRKTSVHKVGNTSLRGVFRVYRLIIPWGRLLSSAPINFVKKRLYP